VHVASTSPLVGTHIPHAVGAAWAARIRGASAATLVYFGEGATSSGDFHTGLNFAGVTRAPVIAVCKNNGLAISTPASKQTASAGFAVKAVAYGLRGVCVDGADVLAVYSVVREARARAVAGQGGTLVEAVIPGNDAADPIARMRRHLDSRGLGGTEREARLLAEVSSDVDRALAEAGEGPGPARETMFEDVYAGRPWNLAEAGARAHPHDDQDDGEP
jgi:TPP-dependent pyruvate/acetoin dehydrogenase alpha subunit